MKIFCRRSASALAIAGACCVFLTPTARALDRPSLIGFSKASYAIGHPVLCGANWASWEKLAARFNAPDALGFWDAPFILIDPMGCNDLRHWRTASPYALSVDIFILAHESGHADQLAENPTFPNYNEHDADCRGAKKWRWLKKRLGITKRVPDLFTPQSLKCP